LVGSWEGFFAAQVGASAALAGLVFVGISINLSKIMSFPGLPGRAAEALVMLSLVLFTASLALVPGQSRLLLGLEVFIIGLTVWAISSNILHKSGDLLKSEHRNSFVARMVLCEIAVLPYLIAGIALLAGYQGGLYWLVPGMLACYLVALIGAWVLLIEINR